MFSKCEEKGKSDSLLFWNGIWAQCGKPRHGAVFEIMKRTKHKYHVLCNKEYQET